MIMVEDLIKVAQRVLESYGNIPITGADFQQITKEEASKQGITGKLDMKFEIDSSNLYDTRCTLVARVVIDEVNIGGDMNGD